MYFSIAVILIYGISIAMLVAASTLRRSHSDYELKSFLRSYSRLEMERRSREKQRVTAILKRLDLTASPSASSTPGLVVVASTAPDATAVGLRPPPAGSPSVLPARLPGLDVQTPTASAWPGDRSPPTVSVVDFSASGSHRDDGDDDETVIPDNNVLLHHHHHHRHHQQQQQQQKHHGGGVKLALSHHVSCLPRHLSERSLLLPKSNRNSEFDVRHSSRRNTAV